MLHFSAGDALASLIKECWVWAQLGVRQHPCALKMVADLDALHKLFADFVYAERLLQPLS